MPEVSVLIPEGWGDYELLDSGDGAKLERFGPHILHRPERSALWRRRLPAKRWADADAVFELHEGGTGQWTLNHPLPARWAMRYRKLAFWARLTRFRHTGVFPEQAAHWDWIERRIRAATEMRSNIGSEIGARQPNVLNLFGYTGIATLVAAAAGASVTHVDASKPAIAWARENAELAGLADRPIRWIVDDAFKFVRREQRRGRLYEGIIMDPPVFGRGPKGEIWRFASDFPSLLEACGGILASPADFVVITAYEVAESCLLLHNLLEDLTGSRGGRVSSGELALRSADGRALSTAIYARWARDEDVVSHSATKTRKN